MEFIETAVFTKVITKMMTDDEYSALQKAMIAKPDIGSLIRGTGGLRKFRWKYGNTGKRGGSRIIYYWQVSDDVFYMLYAYPKNSQSDLTDNQRQAMSELVKELQSGR